MVRKISPLARRALGRAGRPKAAEPKGSKRCPNGLSTYRAEELSAC
jgi:hypothetical protein